jgi:hypothetical protein
MDCRLMIIFQHTEWKKDSPRKPRLLTFVRLIYILPTDLSREMGVRTLGININKESWGGCFI